MDVRSFGESRIMWLLFGFLVSLFWVLVRVLVWFYGKNEDMEIRGVGFLELYSKVRLGLLGVF